MAAVASIIYTVVPPEENSEQFGIVFKASAGEEVENSSSCQAINPIHGCCINSCVQPQNQTCFGKVTA
ncbi:hypothetical protein SAY87_020959 [Trapa incisa]|uniref:Uncharacterized protein n=1 Tax=Trapa incisa TaxID=236973 RepID=A0AAN7PQ79_9MYRT|nr:hypothetical protein SAY87_020959 [Trapa incisa]